MKFTKEDVYRSNSVNSMANCISFGDTFLACGMSQSVVLIEQTADNSRIIEQFDGHKSIVTAVSWVFRDLLVSADNSSNLIVWRVNPSNGRLQSQSTPKLALSSSPVLAVHGIQHDERVYLACCSQSELVLLAYDTEATEWIELSRKSFQPNFVLAIRLIGWLDDHNSLLVATGLDNGMVVVDCFNTISWTTGAVNLVLSGHEDWVSSLDVLKLANNEFYLASSSQDNSIRMWRLSINHLNNNPTEVRCDTDWQMMSLGANEEKPAQLRCQLDSVLAGSHENWVTRVRLASIQSGDKRFLEMVSMSMDKTVIVWRRDAISGQWSERARLGQLGGNGLGFIGGDWTSNGSLIVGIGYQGDMIVWARDVVPGNSIEDHVESWHTVANVAGHFGPVEDLAWEPARGRFLVTVSKDHSARLHGPWIRVLDNGTTEQTDWHELGRPQLHGYEMNTVAMVTSTLLVSAGDEKIARVFGMNENCHRGLLAACGHDWLVANGDEGDWAGLRTERVARDALGLSARPDLAGDSIDNQEVLVPLPPRHDAVASDSMWPELAKLYGHAYELWRVATHPGTGLVATACKAADAEHARVILWHQDHRSHGDAGDAWVVRQRLDIFHKSTVVRMQFSARGDRLVTVSKDRQWGLWQQDKNNLQWQLVHHSSRPHQHAKVIWDVDWTADDLCFVTVSRDKKLMLWSAESGHLIGAPLVFPDSVNAVSTMPIGDDSNGCYVFAVGLETGSISIVQFDRTSLVWSVPLTFQAHHDWITRLRFAPVAAPQSGQNHHGNGRYLLASCSKDRFVKIFAISCFDCDQ